MKDTKLWKNNKYCPMCGDEADPQIYSCETGFDYCSMKCAEQHVKVCAPPQGY